MKRILALAILIACTNMMAEDHSEGGAGGVERSAVDQNAVVNRLNNLISACSTGRPGGGDFGGVPPVASVPQPAAPGLDSEQSAAPQEGIAATGGGEVAQPIEGGGTADIARGEQIYNASCIGCHSASRAPALGALSAAQKIGAVSGANPRMPKGGKLSPQEQADLIAFLQTQQ